jgi:GYF domain 2
MNDTNYYYLDGIDKKGPFTKDEIIDRNLIPTTLIYFEGLANWTPLSQFEDLKKTNISEQQSIEDENSIDQINIPQVTNSEPQKIKIPSFLFLVVALSLTTFLSYFYTNIKKEKDLKDIEIKIEAVLEGKDEVCDYKNDGIGGKLKEPDSSTPNDDKGNRLVEYYECENGGWTVLTLKRMPNGFDYIESYSTNMGFKVPETNYEPGIDLGNDYNTSGYSISTDRGTISNAYTEAMKHISSDKENNSYVAGSYLKIKTFDEISTDFYYISNIEPTKYTDGSVNTKSWKSEKGSSVFNSNWIVWYERNGKHLEIVERKDLFNEIWLKYSLINALIATIIFFSFKFRKRIALQVT